MSSLSTARKLTAAARTDITGLCFIARSAILRRSDAAPITPPSTEKSPVPAYSRRRGIMRAFDRCGVRVKIRGRVIIPLPEPLPHPLAGSRGGDSQPCLPDGGVSGGFMGAKRQSTNDLTDQHLTVPNALQAYPLLESSMTAWNLCRPYRAE